MSFKFLMCDIFSWFEREARFFSVKEFYFSTIEFLNISLITISVGSVGFSGVFDRISEHSPNSGSDRSDFGIDKPDD